MNWAIKYPIAASACATLDKLNDTNTDQAMTKSFVIIRTFVTIEMLSNWSSSMHLQQATTLLAGSVQAALMTECYDSIDELFKELAPLQLPVSVIAPLLLKTKDVRHLLKERSDFLELVRRQLTDAQDPELAVIMSHLE